MCSHQRLDQSRNILNDRFFVRVDVQKDPSFSLYLSFKILLNRHTNR